MFEPIHGSAFDLVGKGIANPIGALWTASMMLDHLGARVASTQLMAAIEKVTSTGRVMPADLGGHATTRAVTDAVIDAIET
jgi:tartrate dehydrogenase/decarboxylase/D-malate dehydrogenase